MKVGDLVKMPGCSMSNWGIDGEPEAIGVVTSTAHRSGGRQPRPRMQRIQIYWIQDKEHSWEPAKWLEVISEG